MNSSRLFSIALLVTLLAPLFIAPVIYNHASMGTFDNSTLSGQQGSFKLPIATTIPPGMIRVAIYNEPNITVPTYAAGVGPVITNNYVNVSNLLTAAGYQVTALTVLDIQNHQLMTAHYDLFVMVDNLPRENITNHVKDFWLSGGGIMSLSSSVVFLCYAGIIPPEAEGTDGNIYFNWLSSSDQNVTARHPITQSYNINDLITEPTWTYATFDWPTLMGSSIAGDFIKLGTRPNLPDDVTIVALDPSEKGGRAVQIPDEADPVATEMEALIIDAVQWLCPRPKARIAFDLTHLTYYGIDPWDWDQFATSSYTEWRNDLVSRGYLVDKLQPNPAGNLTTSRLAPYDTLIAAGPGVNYTVAERTAVQSWISGGGSLIIMGDLVAISDSNVRINFLLNGLNMRINNTVNAPGTPLTVTYNTIHPTRESATSYYLNNGGLVNYTGSAQPLWGLDAGNIIIAADDLGAGRIILSADLNGFTDAHIATDHNRVIAINFINWLSSATARVLILTTWNVGAPNIYRAPLPQALNELGVKYFLTGLSTSGIWFFNLSMHLYSWDLIIFNDPSWSVADVYLDEFVDYIDAGGLFIMSFYDVDWIPTHPLWARLGMQFDHTFAGEPPMYIWDGAHDVFNQPINYGDTQFTSLPGTSDDGDAFTVFSNATALAGLTASDTAGEATLVLRNDGQTLYNGYLIDSFSGDQDDSTYTDNLELWMNEVAYMLRPNCEFTINVPATVIQGFPFIMTVDVINQGLTPAVGGNITAMVPPALGTTGVPGPSRTFVLDPGAGTTLSWTVETSGAGNFTITFDAIYHGLPITAYSGGSLSAMIQATPGLPFPLPWWWWIAAIAVIVIVVVVILVICLLRRKGSK